MKLVLAVASAFMLAHYPEPVDSKIDDLLNQCKSAHPNWSENLCLTHIQNELRAGKDPDTADRIKYLWLGSGYRAVHVPAHKIEKKVP